MKSYEEQAQDERRTSRFLGWGTQCSKANDINIHKHTITYPS